MKLRLTMFVLLALLPGIAGAHQLDLHHRYTHTAAVITAPPSDSSNFNTVEVTPRPSPHCSTGWNAVYTVVKSILTQFGQVWRAYGVAIAIYAALAEGCPPVAAVLSVIAIAGFGLWVAFAIIRQLRC